MEGAGKAIGLILFALFLGVMLNYINETHIQIPNVPGTYTASVPHDNDPGSGH